MFLQHNKQGFEDFDYEKLYFELVSLREALQKDASTSEHYVAIGEIAKAEVGAKEKDNNKILSGLKSAGKWAWDKVEKIGVALTAGILKDNLLS